MKTQRLREKAMSDGNRNDVAASQGRGKIVNKPPEVRERRGRISPNMVQREHGSARTSVSDFWLPVL